MTVLGRVSCVNKENFKIVECLAEYLSANNVKNKLNEALIQAAKYKNIEFVEILIGKGADINAKDKSGYTALYWAAYHGQDEIVQSLMGIKGKGDFKEESKDVISALSSAVYKAGADSKFNKLGKLKKYSAKYTKIVDCLARYLSKNKAMDKLNKAMHIAAHNGHRAIVESLIKNGANIEARDKDGQTVLMKAAKQGKS